MDNLLAIDIHDDCVSGVLLEYGQKSTVVRRYGLASMRGSSFSEAVATVVRQTGYEKGECRVSIACEKLFFRNLTLPFADRKKLEKVLPFELEELTSYRIDDFHLDYLASAGKDQGSEIVAAMVEKDYLADILSQLEAEGLDPEIVAVSGLQTAAALVATNPEEQTFVLLDMSFRETTLILVENGKISLVRSLGVDAEKIAGFSLSSADTRVMVDSPELIPEIVQQLSLPLMQTLLSVGRVALLEQGAPCFVNGAVGLYPAVFTLLKTELALEVRPARITDRPLLKIEPMDEQVWSPELMNRALALALWNPRDCAIFNFRTGAFKKRISLKNLQKIMMSVAVPLGALCFAAVGFCWWEYSDLSMRRDALHDEVTGIFREALPEVTRVVNPVQQLQVKIKETRDVYRSGAEGRESIRKLTLLSELSSRIPQTLAIHITRLVADNKDIRIMAETSDFNMVDNIKRELEKSELFRTVVISSANLAPKGGDVRFELKLELK